MTEDELDAIADKVAARVQHNGEPTAAMLQTVAAILKGFGMRAEDEAALSEDFRYLRKWRLGSERVGSIGVTALVTVMVGGVISALWIGFKAMVGK